MKKRIISILVAATLAASMPVLGGCGSKQQSSKTEKTEATTKAPKEVTIPVSSDEALKMDHEKLLMMFVDNGFNAVDYEKYYGMEDLTSSSDPQNGITSSVTIDNKSVFNKGDKVMSNAKVLIDYHSVKRLELPIHSFDLDDDDSPINYEDLKIQFEKAGFSNISTRTVSVDSLAEGTVTDVSIDGKSMKNDIVESSQPCDSKIVITYSIHGKTAETAAPTQAETKQPETKAAESSAAGGAEDSGDVDPDFKAAMDSYEAFFDEYIAFMKKYKDNPGDMTLLSELSEYMKKYSEYTSKMTSIKTDELSPADLAYYTEIHSRILKKLAEVE